MQAPAMQATTIDTRTVLNVGVMVRGLTVSNRFGIRPSRDTENKMRVLKDGGYFLFSGVVLPDADSEGVYDEMMKKINPLHSDYYLESDLLTFARLKGFEPAGSHKIVFRRNVSAMTDYFAQTFGNSDFPAADSDFSGFMKANNEVLSSVYSYDGNDIDEHYTVSLFKRAVL